MTQTIYYGHSNGEDKNTWQTLRDHLENTSRIVEGFGRGFGAGEYSALLGLIHDLGKYSEGFQHRLEGGPKVDHTTAGAQEIIRRMDNSPIHRLIGTMLAYCVAGHHGGLPDYGSPIDTAENFTLRGRLQKTVLDYRHFQDELDLGGIQHLPLSLPIRATKKHEGFSLAFFTRMLYSTLVDADFIDTETFMAGATKPRGRYASIEDLSVQYSEFLQRFAHPQNAIHRLRNEILDQCIQQAQNQPGYYSLTVPTGGGKTYSSMAFALKHAAIHGLKRIIYIIPYTSIIEQNAALFKQCLGPENVLEHQSNYDWDQLHPGEEEQERDENLKQKLKLAAENWDMPVVVTTNVQFFESLFSNRSSRCRKLHNIAGSVLIFDEAQMLPRDYLQPCMQAVYELVRNYGCTSVFCTATQPALDRFLPMPHQVTELIAESESYFKAFKRVKITHLGRKTDTEILEQMNGQPQTLCIVNTRRHAFGLFQGLIDEGRYHLSTLMYPNHRKRVIDEIKHRLGAGLPCRVISTQLMEAGIDVDFPVGYRAAAGLDSVIQAAGRVNREAKFSLGTLYVFEPDTDLVRRVPGYIRQGAELANTIFRNHPDHPESGEAILEYYQQLYFLQEASAFDRHEILKCFDKGTLSASFDFETAAKNFHFIDDQSVPVIIPIEEEVKEILNQVISDEHPMRFSRKLQPYTVNIFQQEFDALQACGAIDVYADSFNVLNNTDRYDFTTGLRLPEKRGGEAIFFEF